jgi:hypothetical protein
MKRGTLRAGSTKLRWTPFLLLVPFGCIIQSADELLADRPPVTAVSISPGNAVVEAGGSQQFVSTVIGQGTVPPGVTWTVRPGSPSGPAGTVDDRGLYRVTRPVKANTRDYIVVTSVADPTVAGVATVDVPALTLTIAPTAADLLLGDSLQFTATVQGVVSKRVEWSCNLPIIPNDLPFGTIDANGLYVAPQRPPRYNYVSVTARLADVEGLSDLPSGFAFSQVQLRLRPPVLTGASGPVRSGDALILYGSGFLPDAPGVQWQVLFETQPPGLGGAPVYGVYEDHVFVQVPFGGPWTGRLSLSLLVASFGGATSNMIDAGLPP